MIELISVIIYCCLLYIVGKLLLKVAWGAAKIVAVLLFVLSFPALVAGILLASGFILLLPVGFLVVAIILLNG